MADISAKDPTNADTYVRMASTTQRMYFEALRQSDDCVRGRENITVLWDDTSTDEFLAKYLGPCPVCIPHTPT